MTQANIIQIKNSKGTDLKKLLKEAGIGVTINRSPDFIDNENNVVIESKKHLNAISHVDSMYFLSVMKKPGFELEGSESLLNAHSLYKISCGV